MFCSPYTEPSTSSRTTSIPVEPEKTDRDQSQSTTVEKNQSTITAKPLSTTPTQSLPVTPVKPQSTITGTSESSDPPDSGMHIYSTHPTRFSLYTQQLFVNITSSLTLYDKLQNEIKYKWFYFLFVLIVPIGIVSVILYKRRTHQHCLKQMTINEQCRRNAGVYLHTTTALTLDNISDQNNFSDAEDISLQSFQFISNRSRCFGSQEFSDENIYDSILSFHETQKNDNLLEQDGYLVPSRNLNTKF